MDRQSNAAPIIIKRKKNIIAGGHHGGAWKVAYADFVTAMMAFFLLMWLLNATTEQQRAGIADYFKPVPSISTSLGGGTGFLQGDSVTASMNLSTITSDEGGAEYQPLQANESDSTNKNNPEKQLEKLTEKLETELLARTGESMTMERLMRHVVSRVTDEGFVVELFDLPNTFLFEPETAQPTKQLLTLTSALAEVFAATNNQIAVNGHVRVYPLVLKENPVWELSASRAQSAHQLLLQSGILDIRIERVSGFADRKPVTSDPTLIRNNRLEVILLRKDR